MSVDGPKRTCAPPHKLFASWRKGDAVFNEYTRVRRHLRQPQYDATCIVPPGATAERDAAGNIVIALA